VEFERLRDTLVEAIREEKISRVESCLEVYRVAVEAFVGKLREYGALYNFDAARREASSIEGGWPEIEWIKDDLRVTIDAAFKYRSPQILRKVIFFPIALALIALDESEYYVFEQFLSWAVFSYRKGRELPTEDERREIVELIARFLREISDYQIEPRFRYATDGTEIDRTAEFSRGMVVVWSQLLKAAFDKRDANGFRLFAQTLSGLKRLEDETSGMNDELLRLQPEQPDLPVREREEIQQKADMAVRVRRAREHFDRLRDEAMFGIGAWAVQKHLELDGGVPDIPSYYEVLQVFGDLTELTTLYYGLWKQSDRERMFGWEWWIMEEVPDRQTVSIDFNYYLSRFYCLKALEVLRGHTAGEAARVGIPLDESLEFMVGRPDGDLERALNEIREKREKLSPMVDAGGIDAIPKLKEILQQGLARQREKETSELIAAPLDDGKVQGFLRNVIREWRQGAVLRAVVRRYGDFIPAGAAPEKLGFYGFNVMDRKDVYVAKSRVHASDWGEEYGRSIARSENEVVLSTIAKAIMERDASKVKTPALTRLDEAIATLSARCSPNVLVLSHAWHIATMMQQSPDFRAGELSGFSTRDFIGYYRDIPVFQIHGRGERARVYVLDLKQLGTWYQYSTRQVFEGELAIEIFRFYLQPYDEGRARELLRERPKLTVDEHTGQPLEESEAIRRLQKSVHLRILEQFEYKVENADAGMKLILPRDF